MKLLFLLSLLENIYRTGGHPQCLDFRSPFKPIEIRFCNEYSQYSCCTFSKDKYLEREYQYITRSFYGNKTCFGSVKDMLCLECHPYAAHVFDIETQISNRVEKTFLFPGLCKNFCYEHFESCQQFFQQLFRNDGLISFIKNSSTADFCAWAEISDSSYCYPNLKSLQSDAKINDLDNKVILCVEISRESFSNPLFGTHSNDGSHRLFIIEQRGTVFIVDHKGMKSEKPFLNITEKVLNSGYAWDERGLLCLVFHPKYKTNGRFYIYYSAERKYKTSDSSTKNHQSDDLIRISEFIVDPLNPNMADHSSELVLLEIKQPEANHNGGMMLFGDDGYLYISVGDGGGSGDQHGDIGNGLNMTSLLGKLLRIDVDSENHLYSIPIDNPFVNYNNAKPEIYAFGVRNSWRCSKDRGDNKTSRGRGRIFCGDVGQNKIEEINLIEKGGNYGWRAFEGKLCYDEKLCSQRHENLKFPILSYNHSVGQSIVGGYTYRGCANPNLYGKYLYADTMNGRMFLAEENRERWESRPIVMGDKSLCNNGLDPNYFKHILSFAENEAGELFILAVEYPDPLNSYGKIYRLVDPFERGDPEKCTNKIRKPLNIKRRRRLQNQHQTLTGNSNI